MVYRDGEGKAGIKGEEVTRKKRLESHAIVV